jgi:HSP20 family protein
VIRVISASVPESDDLDRLKKEIQELFSDLWHVPRFAGRRQHFRPHVDSYWTSEPPALHVLVELPGVEPDDIQLLVTETGLLIRGHRRRPRVPGQVYEQMELDYGAFERQIPLRQPVNTAAAQATLERGVLSVVLPLAPAAPRPGRVTIVIGSRS